MKKVVPIVPEKGEEGNTRPPPKKQISPALKWCFTLHKYTDININFIIEYLDSSNSSYIFSEEKGKSGETPHLQGYIIFKKKLRPKNIWEAMPLNNTIHWEKAKGSLTDNINYIRKEGGKIYHSKDIKIPKPLVKLTFDMLREDQRRIADLFVEDEDPLFGRKVYWFWEKYGCWGKSILCKYMIDNMGAFVVQGKNNDILCGISAYIEKYGECPRIVIFDIPRVNDNHISYQAIESLKNGFFFSGKYESGMVRFNSPHILIFSNEEPEDYNLSKDRWIIEELKKGE